MYPILWIRENYHTVSRRPASSRPGPVPIVHWSWRPTLRQRSRDRRRDDVINQSACAPATPARFLTGSRRKVCRACAIRRFRPTPQCEICKHNERWWQSTHVICIIASQPRFSSCSVRDSTGRPARQQHYTVVCWYGDNVHWQGPEHGAQGESVSVDVCIKICNV